MKTNNFPKIIWVASRPPIPPFSGSTSKSLCGIAALSEVTSVKVVSFVEREKKVQCECTFNNFWKERVNGINWVEYGPQSSSLSAAISWRFKFGVQIENSYLHSVLDGLSWKSPDNLLIFDDIIFAPLMTRYGTNAILSPHDCMSKMFWSNLRGSKIKMGTVKYLLQGMIARHYESTFFNKALLIHVVTQRDRVWLEAINTKAKYAVVPNSDLLNPGFTGISQNNWDVLIWGNMGIRSISYGVKVFLDAARKQGWLKQNTIMLAGRVAAKYAQKIIGEDLFSLVTYMPNLEDNNGKLQHAKITVIADVGGAGIKNRCVNILSSGKCLACIYSQMEGIEKACDLGAINATTLAELADRVKKALHEETWMKYAKIGQDIYKQEYSENVIQKLWANMVERAIMIRSNGQ